MLNYYYLFKRNPGPPNILVVNRIHQVFLLVISQHKYNWVVIESNKNDHNQKKTVILKIIVELLKEAVEPFLYLLIISRGIVNTAYWYNWVVWDKTVIIRN